MARLLYGKNTKLLISEKPNKKYKILNPETEKYIHFEGMKNKDYTKYIQDDKFIADKNRDLYLARATEINGNWKNDKCSPNSLSINLLWKGYR